MAHFPVRHPYGASIATVMLFKIVPDDFVEPSISYSPTSIGLPNASRFTPSLAESLLS